MLFKMRKNLKRTIISSFVIVLIYFFIKEISDRTDNSDSRLKMVQIEESIRSLSNKFSCKVPYLPHDAPEMMKFMKNEEPIVCDKDTEEDWVVCYLSLCTIKRHIIEQKNGLIQCDFSDVIRDGDFGYRLSDPVKTTKKYVLQNSDIVRVTCKANDGSHWHGTLIGVRKDVSIMKNKNSARGFNVMMFGFDSLSRNAFIRKLPKSYEYLTKELHAHVLKAYNIIGDGTPQALIPILTGYTELELPEVRKRKFRSDYVNVYPMIWKKYQDAGYVTSFNEDQPNIGTFSYRLNGFKQQPTDHYMRTFYLAIERDLKNYKRLCVGSKKRHQIMFDYAKEMIDHYNQSNINVFQFSFHAELSHDSINLVGVIDDDLVAWLKSLKTSKILDNTIFILMSDHGNRFAEIRNTLQGKMEERLPFFSFVFPDKFKQLFPTQYKNFVNNIEQLSTPFDIHETLEDILHLEIYGKNKKSEHQRAISLFKPIPERSCADAYIEPHFCSCLKFSALSLNGSNSYEVSKVVDSVIETINEYTKVNRNLCSILKLEKVESVSKLLPQTSLLRFKKNKDTDGFVPDMGEPTKMTYTMYQVKIVTSPNDAIYEASAFYDLDKKKFLVKIGDISRINKYGAQAWCIYDENPELRKFCSCIQSPENP